MNTSITNPVAENQQFGFWARLPLARKLQFAFAALFVFTLIIAVTTLWGLNQVQTRYQTTLTQGVEMRRLANVTDIELLRARRAEKNFQLRWKAEGFDTAYTNYVPLFNDAIKAMREDVDALSKLGAVAATVSTGDVTQASYETDIASLKQDIDAYETSFRAEVDAYGKRGYSETTGYEGQFRVAARSIEDELSGKPGLETMFITYLEARRNEKDYLERGGQEYVDNVQTYVAQLKSQILESNAFDAPQKTQMLGWTDEYLTAFNGLVEIDKEIATHDAALVEASRAVEPLTVKMLTIGTQLGTDTTVLAETTARQIIVLSLIIVVLALVIAVVLALTISRQLTRPIIALTATAQEISGGKFDVKAEVNSADEIGTLANTFNLMTSRLGAAFEDVRRRTLAVQTSSEVSRRLSTATNARQLAVDVVEQVQSAFNYYHAHIYFVDQNTGDLIMAGGTGEAGATMLARGHKVAKGRGLVGRAAETNTPVLVQDVSKAEGWLPNPLLPETKSEVAIPISSGRLVLGVIDVQQNRFNGLGEEDVELLQSLAGQVAISYLNARTFEESRVKADLEAMVNTIGQKIQRSTSVEETLQTAIRELGQALGAERVKASIGKTNNN
jgi:putative methionine-R-sulfoxide reductase with GAF domain